jgi:SAM-dependent methyltransferase
MQGADLEPGKPRRCAERSGVALRVCCGAMLPLLICALTCLTRISPTTTSIDVSGVFLATARKNLAGLDVTFIKGEVDNMDPMPTGFDRVICTEVLERTKDPRAILDAIARMLAPGGLAVITVPNDPLIARLKRVVRLTPVGWLLRKRIEWGGDAYHLHHWTPSQFRRVLQERFVIVQQRCAPFDWAPIRACFLCEPKSGQPRIVAGLGGLGALTAAIARAGAGAEGGSVGRDGAWAPRLGADRGRPQADNPCTTPQIGTDC